MKIILNFFIVIIFLFLAPAAFAQEKINSFDVNITAHSNGSMTVKENIEYNFEDEERHGIFRTIPLISRVGDLYRVIEVEFNEVLRDGKNEPFSVNKGSSESEVKIGDPDKTITGLHTYIIIYTVKNGIGANFEDHDEIYWNVTGNNWQIQVEKASYKLETDFGGFTTESICFTGVINSKEQNCKVNENLVNLTQTLREYEGLTVVSKFPINTFPKSILQKNEPFIDPDFWDFMKIYAPIMLVLNFLVSPYLLFWYFKKKSKIRFGNPSVNFDIPKDISPVEAGIIDNHKLEKNDIVATIFDLAIRKYIKIEEVKEKRTLMPDKTDYKIINLHNEHPLNSFENILMERFFEVGNTVMLEELKSDFYKTFEKLEKESFKLLIEKKLYLKNPKNQRAGMLIGGIIALVFGNLVLGLVMIFLSKKLTGRTLAGDKLDWEIDGLKIFLKSVSRYHSWQSKKLITAEKYIPFAIALGLQNEFMEQLKIINPDYKPEWYSGSRGFYYTYPAMYSTFGSSVTTSAPSSSSGFSGGGSSGGGGGGGGGGSW